MPRTGAGGLARAALAGLTLAPLLAPAAPGAEAAGPATRRPVVVAHRGASGERPEHTLEAYRLAIEQGADFVEPDLVATRDGVLVCRHENEIGATTDAADRPEFAARRASREVDGRRVSGWFVEDFTLAELRTLHARERLPALRGTAFDGRFRVPTFDEVLELVAAENARPQRRGRPVGVYPETKHPSYFAARGLALEPRLVAALRRHRLDRAEAPVFVQSFEVGNLRRLSSLARVRLVQLMDARGGPWDLEAAGAAGDYARLARPEGLRQVASYAQAIGVHQALVLPRDAAGRSLPPTSLVRDAHRAGLLVHVWALRAEDEFLPPELRAGSPGRGPQPGTGMAIQARRLLEAGVDGFFTDHPALGVAARDAFLARR